MSEPEGVDEAITRVFGELAHAAVPERKAIIDRLVLLCASELRQRASYLMGRERPNHMLQTTALFNETYLRLVNSNLSFEDRRHFLAMSARLMREIMVDAARRSNAQKRGEGIVATALDYDTADQAAALDPASLIDLNNALANLGPEEQELVELRFFYGLTLEETAQAMSVNYEALRKRWVSVRRQLFHSLTGQ